MAEQESSVTERPAVRVLTPRSMVEVSSLRVAPETALVPRSVARLSPVKERLQILCATPTLAAILVMPLAGFLFAGLFLGELVGALLGLYFAGLNGIFAWSRLPILGQSLTIAPGSDHPQTLLRRSEEPLVSLPSPGKPAADVAAGPAGSAPRFDTIKPEASPGCAE